MHFWTKLLEKGLEWLVLGVQVTRGSDAGLRVPVAALRPWAVLSLATLGVLAATWFLQRCRPVRALLY